MSVHFFGIRHLSPAGAYYLRGFLDEKRPKMVLIEAPSDFSDVAADIIRSETQPPFAILAYTNHAPVRTILYPFAEYSPEYQAILWCHENNVEFRFMDLPSETFLALYKERIAEETKNCEKTNDESVYKKLERFSPEHSHETFWERTLEHCENFSAYNEGANLFGKNIREFSEEREDMEEILLREKYMRGCIRKAAAEGAGDIVVVTGAYHVEGLKQWQQSEESPVLPKTDSLHTLMPYSYYRLSTRSGYGAGNKAPGYYELIWKAYNLGEPFYTANAYLTQEQVFKMTSTAC